MFELQMRITRKNIVGQWFPIWHTADGNDCAEYMKSCVINDTRPEVEYKMIYKTA